MKVLVLVLWSIAALSCGSGGQPMNLAKIEADAAVNAQPTPTLRPQVLTSEEVMLAFKRAGIPVINEVVYTESSDPNNLLGRPGQYVGKVNFLDKRIEKKALDKKGCTVEVFLNDEDLQRRKTYLENISKTGGPFLQYIYSHKNVLLRLEHQLLPDDAARYNEVLKSL